MHEHKWLWHTENQSYEEHQKHKIYSYQQGLYEVKGEILL